MDKRLWIDGNYVGKLYDYIHTTMMPVTIQNMGTTVLPANGTLFILSSIFDAWLETRFNEEGDISCSTHHEITVGDYDKKVSIVFYDSVISNQFTRDEYTGVSFTYSNTKEIPHHTTAYSVGTDKVVEMKENGEYKRVNIPTVWVVPPPGYKFEINREGVLTELQLVEEFNYETNAEGGTLDLHFIDMEDSWMTLFGISSSNVVEDMNRCRRTYLPPYKINLRVTKKVKGKEFVKEFQSLYLISEASSADKNGKSYVRLDFIYDDCTSWVAG